MAGPVVTGAGHHIREHLGHPGGGKGVVLLIKGLGYLRSALPMAVAAISFLIGTCMCIRGSTF